MTDQNAPPFAVGMLDHVVLRVTDMDRSIAFYRDVVGANEERRVESIGLVQMRAGASLIDLVPAGDTVSELGNMEHFALSIDRFDEASIHAHLVKHGVEPGEVGRRYGAQGYGPSIYFDDPDGNTVELKGPPEE